MTRHAWRMLALLAVLVLALVAAGCGGDDDEDEGAGATTTAEEATTEEEEQVSGSVSVMGIWVGEEQKSFQAVIDGFKEQQPDVTVKYNPVGDNLPTVLGTAVQGGNPPDIAAMAEPTPKSFAPPKLVRHIASASTFASSWTAPGATATTMSKTLRTLMSIVMNTTVSTGARRGTVTRRKTCHSLPPSVRAASSTSRGIAARPAAMTTMANPAQIQM